MSRLRVLHVDDEPDIREIVEMSLALDPGLLLKSCASGRDALAQAVSCLRENADTAAIPVIFMTARALIRDLEHLMSLGAAGVIAKPFDPMGLAGSVRSCVARTNGHEGAPAPTSH
jgi:CheY-like chemotaxis protein